MSSGILHRYQQECLARSDLESPDCFAAPLRLASSLKVWLVDVKSGDVLKAPAAYLISG